MSWELDVASERDIDELMTWFADAHSVDIWGGPAFRYPFDRTSFREDCRWLEFSSYSLRNPDGELAAFGQLGSRFERSHLARLVTHPDMRGQGVGRKLLERMIIVAQSESELKEVALFVYKHNEPACRCYRSMGFEIQDYPDGAPLRDECYYMARPVDYKQRSLTP
jgi:ribosomal protein S18 acetylase RimI-like enzyme